MQSIYYAKSKIATDRIYGEDPNRAEEHLDSCMRPEVSINPIKTDASWPGDVEIYESVEARTNGSTVTLELEEQNPISEQSYWQQYSTQSQH